MKLPTQNALFVVKSKFPQDDVVIVIVYIDRVRYTEQIH